ncbi:MAG: hypothetical protein K8H86_04660 [Ignavibacteriaceae bacterium]|nr:hypothetical protein [Ignavibacteriaceae bacterium]
MKKGSKPFILYALFVIIALTLLVLGFVGVKLENEILAKQKLAGEEKLSALRNARIDIIAELQNYSAEERIMEVALKELNMVKPEQPAEIKYVSKEKIEMINKILLEKYE